MKRGSSKFLTITVIVYGIIIWFVGYAKAMSMKSHEAFMSVIREDGWVEYLTFLFLALCAIIFLVNTIKAVKRGDKKQIIFNLFACLVFVFGAGEEISWGQRIFGIQTGDYFMHNNYQGETNLHNLEIDGVDLNRLIFSKLMFVALVGYFIVLPFFTYKTEWVRKKVVEFGVPIPRLHHVVVMLAVNIFIPVFINLKKESELHELALAGIMFLILLNPAKRIKEISLKK